MTDALSRKDKLNMIVSSEKLIKELEKLEIDIHVPNLPTDILSAYKS